jgi:hypothetical protein
VIGAPLVASRPRGGGLKAGAGYASARLRAQRRYEQRLLTRCQLFLDDSIAVPAKLRRRIQLQRRMGLYLNRFRGPAVGWG